MNKIVNKTTYPHIQYFDQTILHHSTRVLEEKINEERKI
jgi:hypothetical protein